MAIRLYKKGTVKYSNRLIDYKVVGGMKIRHAILYMREGAKKWEKMAVVHPSIYSTAIRQFAADYVRYHKKRRSKKR